MAKVPQTPDDLQRHLEEQLRFLRRSVEDYDSGDTAEAKRLATHIRTLIHDSQHLKSLLVQVGEADRLFCDTSFPDTPENLASYWPLIAIQGGENIGAYVPRLDVQLSEAPPRYVPVREWWERPVFRTQSGHVLTRRTLILAVSDQDGGAHVDPRLSESYAELSRRGGTGWNIMGAELATVRQIAHEVLKTFDRTYRCILRNPAPMLMACEARLGGRPSAGSNDATDA